MIVVLWAQSLFQLLTVIKFLGAHSNFWQEVKWENLETLEFLLASCRLKLFVPEFEKSQLSRLSPCTGSYGCFISCKTVICIRWKKLLVKKIYGERLELVIYTEKGLSCKNRLQWNDGGNKTTKDGQTVMLIVKIQQAVVYACEDSRFVINYALYQQLSGGCCYKNATLGITRILFSYLDIIVSKSWMLVFLWLLIVLWIDLLFNFILT